MAFKKAQRQKIIDGYLSETGRNLFVPAEFIDWLQGQPEHEAYEWFYGKDDATCAREHRIFLARQMANGLRIAVTQSKTETQVVQITQREYPAYVSPVAQRTQGGGYQRFDPDDAEALAELTRQGQTAMRSWLDRYGAAFEKQGCDLSALREIAGSDTSVAITA